MPPAKLSKGSPWPFLIVLLVFSSPGLSANPVGPPTSDTLFLNYFVTRCFGDNFMGTVATQDTTITQFAAGATGTDTVFTWILEVVPIPDFSFSADTFRCEAYTATLEVLGTYAGYQWSTGQTSKSITVSQDGWYTVTVTNSLGCMGVDSFEVIGVHLQLEITSSDPSCAGVADGLIEIIALGANSPGPHRFYLNDTLWAGPLFQNLSGGPYQVRAIDAAGCRDSAEITLLEPPGFDIDLGPDITLSTGEIHQFVATGNQAIAQFQWSPAALLDCDTCPMPNWLQNGSGVISLEAYSVSGCSASDSIRLVYTETIPLYVPTAFSPNGDGQNDWLTVSSGSSIRELSYFRVFDRWGNLVFSLQNQPANPQIDIWNGSVKGKKPAPGVYTWVASVRFFNESTAIQSGTFTIVL